MRANPEQIIQEAVIRHLRKRGVKGLVFWHCPNGAFYGAGKNFKAKAIRGAALKRAGVLPGVSDICLFHKCKFFALELKAPPNTPTESQLKFISDINWNGGFGAVANSLDRALEILKAWGLIR